MYRDEFGEFEQYVVRWNGCETRICVTGKLTFEELSHLIDVLQQAKNDRQKYMDDDSLSEPQPMESIETFEIEMNARLQNVPGRNEDFVEFIHEKGIPEGKPYCRAPTNCF